MREAQEARHDVFSCIWALTNVDRHSYGQHSSRSFSIRFCLSSVIVPPLSSSFQPLVYIDCFYMKKKTGWSFSSFTTLLCVCVRARRGKHHRINLRFILKTQAGPEPPQFVPEAAAPMQHHDTYTDEISSPAVGIYGSLPPSQQHDCYTIRSANRTLQMNYMHCTNGDFPFTCQGVFDFCPPSPPSLCRPQLQPATEALVFLPSISYRWPLCSSGIDLSLLSPLSITYHMVSKVALCVTRDGSGHRSHTSPSLPSPTHLGLIWGGYRCGPFAAVSRLGPRKEFERLTQWDIDLFSATVALPVIDSCPAA